MDGTSASGDKIARDPPSPFVAEVEGRLRDIASGKATPWNDPVEKRREARRRDMEIARLVSLETLVRFNEMLAGRLPSWQCEYFQDTKDPLASMAKFNRSMVQVALVEERFDENDETRAERRAAEAEARAKAEREEDAKRAYTASQVRRAENRREAHHAIREITIAGLSPFKYEDRENLLSGLFAELDADESRYDRDPAAVIAEIASRLGIAPKLRAVSKDKLTAIAERRAALIAVARDHLEALRGPHEIDADCAAATIPVSSAPPAQAHGPP